MLHATVLKSAHMIDGSGQSGLPMISPTFVSQSWLSVILTTLITARLAEPSTRLWKVWSLFSRRLLFFIVLKCLPPALGAVRIVDRAEVDQEDWPVIENWFGAVKAKLSEIDIDVRADYIVSRRYCVKRSPLCKSRALTALYASGSAKQEKHGRLRPFSAEMITKYDLCDIPPVR